MDAEIILALVFCLTFLIGNIFNLQTLKRLCFNYFELL